VRDTGSPREGDGGHRPKRRTARSPSRTRRGTVPYLLVSRYQRNASAGSLCSSIRLRRSSWSWILWLPPMISPLALGSQDIDAEGTRRVRGVGLHIERLDRRGIVGHHHRSIEGLGQQRLVERPKSLPWAKGGRPGPRARQQVGTRQQRGRLVVRSCAETASSPSRASRCRARGS